MIEAAADIVGDAGIGHHLCPVEQEIIVIENVVLLLGLDVRREKFLEFIGPAGAPQVRRSEHLVQLGLGVDAA
ncbi:hypothetical protein ES703_52519 [subsurface metagenome]